MNIKNAMLLFAIVLSSSVLAQKGSISKAESYLAKQDYVNAQAEIDMAITITKVATKSKTWFVRGKIYQAIANSLDEAVTALDTNALSKATEAYSKVIAIAKETNPIHLLSITNLDRLWGDYMNTGGELYGEAKYDEALSNFENALIVRPSDSITLRYAGIAAQQAKKTDKTQRYYYQMHDANIASADVYATLIYMERTLNENNEKALELVLIAKEKFPKEKKFRQEEISLLLTLDKIKEAKSKLEIAITKDSGNLNAHLNLAILYDNLGSAKKAEGKTIEARDAYNLAKKSYMNVVAIEPNNYIANFNIGVLFVNLAKEYYDVVRNMDLKEAEKSGATKTKEADVILKQGLPYMEKATIINTKDIAGLTALQQMYIQLKMHDKAEAIMTQLDALEATN